jgi:hypothetical protein
MHKSLVFVLAVMGIWLHRGQAVSAQQSYDNARAELAKALVGAKASIEQGLAASEREGTPISGKFELDEGKLQLSIYTMKGDTFSEVIIDHTTGKVAKVEPIMSGDDLTAATAQRAAMVKAKRAPEIVDTAVKTYTGFQAVSLVPAMKGHAVAEMTLVKDRAFTTIPESLD